MTRRTMFGVAALGALVAVHLIVGSEDRALDHQLLRTVADRNDHVELHAIAGAGHDLPLSHPDDCLEAMRTMLHTTRAT